MNTFFPPLSRVYIGLMGVALVACNGPSNSPDNFSAPSEAGPATLRADVTLFDALPDEALEKAGSEAVAVDITLNLYRDIARSDLAFTATETGLPMEAVSIQIPVDLQGSFYYSATLTTEDGRSYLSGDQLEGFDGEPIFPESLEETLSLTFDQSTDLHLSLYESVDIEGSASFNKDLGVQLILTDEQEAMVAALSGAKGRALLTGCVAYGSTATALSPHGAGGFVWDELDGAVLIVGEPCTLEVLVEEAGAPRLRGEVDFVAPAEGGVLPLQMDLFVVDAFVDAFFDVDGMLANVTFAMDDGLEAYLDEGDWATGLSYSLSADNGVDSVLLTEMDRQGSTLRGSLFPLNDDAPVYVVTLSIWDGGTIVLQGSGVVDFSEGESLHLTFGYELGIEIETENFTNVYFHAWLDDKPEVVAGAYVSVAVTDTLGEVSTEACDIGTGGNYTCLLRLPLGATIQPTYSYPGYLTVVEEPIVIESLNALSLPYVRLIPEGCEGGNYGDPEVCDGLDNDCDGEADEGLMMTVYGDRDGDGFGDSASRTLRCDLSEGHVLSSDDCDDERADIYPGAEEICDGADGDCDGDIDEEVLETFYADSDGDGFGASGSTTQACEAPEGFGVDQSDCDDADPMNFPGAEELCDGLDNDCDGVADEGVTSTFYADADGDGFGDPLSPVESCEAPEGHVSDSQDCDDLQAETFPGAAETCDGRDEDCDGTIDEEMSSTFFVDSDGDGFGDDDQAVESCSAPQGHVPEGGDCDDGQSGVSPASVEACNGRDDDCDGDIDEGSRSLFYGDLDGDGHGDVNDEVIECQAPEGYVSLSDDCDDTSPEIYPGSVELCNEVDEDCDGRVDEGSRTAFYADVDLDGHGDPEVVRDRCVAPEGFVTTSDDCDDENPEVFPGAEEVCNRVDEDCDGSIDEGTQVIIYTDSDADGWGEEASSRYACYAAAGWSDTPGDCDDSEGEINPDALEICDTIDNDCDELVDEDVTTTFYVDADQDGFGDETRPREACTLPSGYTLNSEDCDDSRGFVSPEGTEVCDELDLDEDCDGGADDDDVEGAEGETLWYQDSDEDGYGALGTEISACNLPIDGGTWSDDNRDCDDAEVDINPAAAEVCGDGVDNNCDSQGCLYGDVELDWASAKIIGENKPDRAGYDVAYGDFNGDGFSDLLVPAYRHNQGGSNAGAVYVIYGPNVSGTIDLSNADAEIVGENAGDNAGYSVDNAGDVNGDGIDDILIGAPFADSNGVDSGAAYVVYGPVDGVVDLETAGARLRGESTGDRAGWSVSTAGDVNNDGFDDVLIGAVYHDAGGENAGAAYLVLGPVVGSTTLDNADAKIAGDNPWDLMGFAVSEAGDLNADGYDDFVVGANKDDEAHVDAGTAYVVHGPVTGDIAHGDTVRLFGGSAGDYAARSLAGGADINGDGYDDLVIGAFFESPGSTQGEAAWVVYGPIDETMSLSAADALITGDSSFYRNKVYVSIVEDIDGDSLPDILLGFHHESDGDFFGSAYLFTATPAGTINVSQAEANMVGAGIRDYLGSSVSSAGDVNGDGFNDLIIGSWGDDDGAVDAGAAYLFLGGL